MINIYSIPYPHQFDKEEFAGLFSVIDVDGVEEKEDKIEVYINDSQLAAALPYIEDVCQIYNTTFTKSELENKNWNAQWESSFQPILIDDEVYVRATFHPENKAVKHEIIIEPKMSFGTGHHPTTTQMIKNMHLLDFKDKTVLDCGSGTGILAILAEKLAQSCIALDNDEWCYRNCMENMQLNHTQKIQPEIGGIEKINHRTFDIILANIHRNFLVENMHLLASALNANGFLIVSGFYSEDAKQVLNKALEHHLIATYHTHLHNWDCIVFNKKNVNV